VILGIDTSVLIFVVLNILLASSIQVVASSGFFSVASIAFAGIGAYSSAILTTHHHLAFLPAALPGLAISMCVAPLFLLPARRLQGMYFALATLAFVLVLQIVFENAKVTGGALGVYGIPLVTTLPLCLAILALFTYIVRMLSGSRTGRALRAMRHDPQLASALGVNLTSYRFITLEISAAMAALYGSLSAQYLAYISPDMFGFAAVTTAVEMAIIGGLGAWIGPYIGAVVLTLIQQWLSPFPNFSDIVGGVLIIAIMVLQPGGLVVIVHGAWDALRLRARRFASGKPSHRAESVRE
jgi:branched-chain amino acid transport system permease protein